MIMSGGWAGGSASSAEFIKNADLMWKQSVWSSGISAAVAAQHLKTSGCIVLPGAKPALGGTPGNDNNPYLIVLEIEQFKGIKVRAPSYFIF